MAKKRRKSKPTINEAMRSVLDYVLENEQEDYIQWCEDEGHEIDDKAARNAHVYGSACKALGRKPSYFINVEVSNE